MHVTGVTRSHPAFKDGKQTKPPYITVDLEDLGDIEEDKYYSESRTRLTFRLPVDEVPPRLGDNATVQIVFGGE